MTGEEFKGFCERFYDYYGEYPNLEKGDKFEIRFKTGEAMDVDKDNVYFPEHGETFIFEIFNQNIGSKYYHEFIPASEISCITVIESSPTEKRQISW